MKIKTIISVLLLLILYTNSFAGKLKIKISNIKEKKGAIHYGIYNSPNDFPDEKGKIIGGYIEVSEVLKNGLVIKNLDEAYYAVAIFHDKNSNNEFDSFLAIPTERYGFSRNAPVFLGPPKFEDASVFVGASQEIELNIELR